MARQKTALTPEVRKAMVEKTQEQMSYYGDLAEEYWRKYLPKSYKELADQGPEAVWTFFQRLGTQAQEDQVAMMQEGLAEEGAWEIVKDDLFPAPEE